MQQQMSFSPTLNGKTAYLNASNRQIMARIGMSK